MANQYRPFIDWLKAAGIVLIVCGHVAARPINHLTPPIYPKQLGVAFFLFVLGVSLAQERRPRAHVVFRRLFDVYVYALPLALIISGLAPLRGTANPSNYLPLLFGANLLVNDFPANPSTWYVGTYAHIVVAWALFVRFRVRAWMLALSLVVEILMRAALYRTAGGFVAYMSLFNWSTVVLCGIWWGQRCRASNVSGQVTSGSPWPWIGLLAGVAAGWALWMPAQVEQWSFPFVVLASRAGFGLLTFVLVSAAYLTFTLLALQVARRLPAPSAVRFVARNTLIVFLAHMPVYYLLESLMRPYALPYALVACVNLAVCLVGLALVSEAVNRLVHPRALRDGAAARLFKGRWNVAAIGNATAQVS